MQQAAQRLPIANSGLALDQHESRQARAQLTDERLRLVVIAAIDAFTNGW